MFNLNYKNKFNDNNLNYIYLVCSKYNFLTILSFILLSSGDLKFVPFY